MTEKNPLLCDPVSGLCSLPSQPSAASAPIETAATVKIIYFTDPICSSCWGIEPQLRRLKLEYGRDIEIEYRMGGLLPDWSYNSGGISKPSDVAHHWDEVSRYYDMPIDGRVWLEDPLHSSYPPSVAFKAAALQDPDKAVAFMRRLREMVFLERKNITKWVYMAEAATLVGLDVAQLKTDFETQAPALFQQDLALTRSMGVRGFPTLLVIGSQKKAHTIYGFQSYDAFEAALTAADSGIEKRPYDPSWQHLFKHYPTLTAREFAELAHVSRSEAIATLEKLTIDGHLTVLKTPNGNLWQRRL